MNQQLPLIPLLLQGHPDPRKIILYQQIQNVHRIPPIRPLLPHLLSSNPGGVADPHFLPHLGQQVHKPMAVAGRFQPHAHRPGQLPVKSFGFSIRVHQLPLLNLSDFCIHPSDLLKTGMIITTYNDHVKAPSFPVVLCLQTKNTVSDRAFAFIQSGLNILTS